MRALRGKTAVVTGAASGIGRALASKLAQQGMRLVLADKDERRLRQVAGELKGALAVRTDVSRFAQVEALARRAFDHFGAVHLLCNNAGVVEYGLAWELPLARWRRVLDTNLMGVIHGCLAFVPRMLAQRQPAHILNTASMAGLLALPMAAAYSVSKHGVVALSEALAEELSLQRARIGVSVLCPGWVATRLLESSRGDAPAKVRALVERGLRPETVAERAVRAVREDRLYVLTDPLAAPALRARAEDIATGRLRRRRAVSR